MAGSESSNNPPMTTTDRPPMARDPGQSSSPHPRRGARIPRQRKKVSNTERAVSRAGAAFLSGIIVNPLDIAKTRLQAQAAGVSYSHQLSKITSRAAYHGSNTFFAGGIHGSARSFPRDSFHDRGTIDVLYKIIRKEGVTRLWRGAGVHIAAAMPRIAINIGCYPVVYDTVDKLTGRKFRSIVPVIAGPATLSLALAACYPLELARTRMQAFQDTQVGEKPPGAAKTLLGIISKAKSANNYGNSVLRYRVLWMGLGAHLAREIPYSGISLWIFFPTLKRALDLADHRLLNYSFQLGTIFSAGFIAGCAASALTCPLDVARTWKQIEDPNLAVRMTLKQTLGEIRRKAGVRGLYTGMVPQACGAGLVFGILAVMFFHIARRSTVRARFSIEASF